MEKLISTETREKKVLSMVFLTISLCILANNFLSFITYDVIKPETTGNIIFVGAFTLSNIIIAISAVILAIKCRGVFSIIGGIFLVIATLINLMNASFAHAFRLFPSLQEFLIGNNIIEDPATLFMFYGIPVFVSIIVKFLCLVAYILLAAGTRTSKIFKTTIVATGAFFLFMTAANNFIVPVLFNPDMLSIYFHIYNALDSAIQIVIIAICIFEYISANRQAKSCQE